MFIDKILKYLMGFVVFGFALFILNQKLELFNSIIYNLNNFGIILEIFGFGMFVLSATDPVNLQTFSGIKGDPNFKKKVKQYNLWKKTYLKLPYTISQFTRIISIVIIIIGLVFQFKFSNNPF